jgi:tetratricopeptide (TPR) repeat protein
MAAGGESAIAGWEKLAREKKGSYEAAQALLSLMRAHFKTALNEKKQMTKAPNYAKCAEACDQLLDGKLYQGAGFSPEDWQAIRGEVLFHRAMCELASVAPTPPKPGEAVPAYVSKANVERAIEWFEQARALVDRKQLEMVKSLELGLLEALFKSEKPQRREQAERRLAEVEADYGTDPRFQRLAINLGEWYAQQGRYAEAARQYRSVAERAKNLPDDELLKLYFNAGALFAQAAYEQQKTDTSTICIYIYPKAVVEVGDDVLRTAPFQRPVNIRWPADGQGITAGEALLELSRRTAIPFVWLSAPGPNTIASYLAEKTVNLKNGQYTAAQALAMILDPEHHRVAEDIGLADGKPTLDKERLAREDPDAAREWQLIEIYDERQIAARYKPLGKSYGSFQQHHRQGELLFDILERIEHLVGARILWTENIDSERQKELLAKEFRAVPGRSGTAELSCAEVLTGVLSACDLRWRLIRRQQSAEHYEASNDCYRKAWTIDSKSSFGQRAMFAVALNCFNQREYGKMKRALLTYLKVCDSPSNRYYHEANFWVGWTLEYDRKYREACHYYARAAAERLIIYRPPAGKPLHTREELQKRLSADTQFALFEPVSGEFKDMTLDQFARWVELSARVDTKLDPSVGGMDVKLNRPQFRRVPAFDVLCETLEQLGLTYRVENIDPEAAEKAYYRMALVDRRENRMDSALENCERLLERYPQSPRLREIKKLQVDIFRGLRDYRRVLETLDELRRTAKDPAEKRALDNEVAAMYFDLADYRRAAEAFRSALATSLDPAEGYNIRTAYARALFRSGQFKEALAQYKELVKEPAPPLVTMINNLVLFYLKYRAEEALEQEFPDEAYRFILAYEKLNDVQREKLSAADRTRATWIYYVLGLIDLHKGRTEKAIEKFKAAANSPDDSLAGEAGIRLAETHMQRKEYELARAALEYMLISVRAAEASDALVRGTYLLAQCYEKLERPVKAGERYRELVERYPQSPYAELAQKQPAYRLRPDKPEEKPAGQAVGKP